MVKTRKRLLVMEPAAYGSSVLSLPFVRGAMEQFDVYACCLSENFPIYKRLLPEDRMIPYFVAMRDRPSLRDLKVVAANKKAMLSRLKELELDMAVTAWPAVYDHIIMRQAGIPRRAGLPMSKTNVYGYEFPATRQRTNAQKFYQDLKNLFIRGSLLTDPVNRTDPRQPHLDCWRQLAAELGIPFKDDIPWIPFPENDCCPEELRGFIRQARAGGRSIWLVHPGGSFPSKRWDEENFKKILAGVLNDRSGTSVIIVHPPNEPALAPQAQNQIAYAPETIDDFIDVTSLCDVVLCNDSVASHVGAAFGKTVLTIFRSGNPDWWAPFRNENRVLYAEPEGKVPCPDESGLHFSYVGIQGPAFSTVEKAVKDVLQQG